MKPPLPGPKKPIPTPTSPSRSYGQAKFLADQVVRKFIAENPNVRFQITSLSPVLVMGPSLAARADSTSQGFMYLFRHKIAPNPFVEMMYAADLAFAVVDGRDVAEAVFQAATRPGLPGKNYLISSESYRNTTSREYTYALIGANEEPQWVSIGLKHTVDFAQMKPGTYLFHLKARNSDGVWTTLTTPLHIAISPPWWQSLWSYAAYALLLLLGFQNRVQSWASSVHQKLYQGKQVGAIEMRDYFNNLSESILHSFDVADRITINCSMPELLLDIDTAISVGLLTNELLTNSLKYAFVGKEAASFASA